MKKALCFLLGLSLVFCLTACQKETPAPEKPVSEEGPPDAGTENAPAEDQAARPGLFWETGIAPVEYEMDWTVEGTAETYVLELTDPKYQGRAGGSEGNRAAAGWLAEQFSRVGLQKLPTLGSWKQTYQTTVTAVLPGEAFLVSPDGEETELKLGGIGCSGPPRTRWTLQPRFPQTTPFTATARPYGMPGRTPRTPAGSSA